MTPLGRREFLAAAAVAAPGPVRAAAQTGTAGARFIKSICAGIFPRGASYAECFRLARNAGFEGIELTMQGEISLSSPAEQLQRLGETARNAGIAVASLWVSPLGSNPLNSPDPAVRGRGLAAIRKALEFAGCLGCGALLLVPGRVGSGARFEVGYETTWERFTSELRKVIPDAERARVLLTIENVSNQIGRAHV